MNGSHLRRGLLLLVLATAALSAPRPASAQLTRADTAAAVLAVAEDFENRGADEVAEALYRYVLQHYPETDAARVARARLEVVTSRQSWAGGDIELKVWSTMYGLWQGVAIPLAAGADDTEVYGLGLLLGGPVGFLTGREMGRSRSLGQARAITWGGTWGAIQGWGWARALDFGSDDYGARYGYDYGDDESTEAAITSMIVGGALGIGGGLALARREITPGAATSAMLGSLWGMWFGVSTGVLMDIDEGDGLLAASMIAGNAGLVAGALAGSRIPLSRGRARMISLGGLIGAFGGGGLVLIAQPDGPKTAMAMMLVSSIAGLAAGAAGTRDDRGESDRSQDLEAAASLPAPGSLLNWSDGNWALSTPLPTPVLEPTPQSGGRDGLIWKVPLLNVRF